MNWSFVLFAFSLAVLTGAIGVTTLNRLRPQWSAHKQGLMAASILPAIAIASTLAGIANLLLSGGIADGMRDLALATIVQAGVLSAGIGFIGGLVGVLLRQRGLRR